MDIGILGTGTLAEALGGGWTKAGHTVTVGGRSAEKTAALAARIGARAATPREAASGRDAVLLSVTWTGVAEMLAAAGAADGALRGVPLLDPTNAMEHGVGDLLTPPGHAVAEDVAAAAPGAHVVKGLNLQPSTAWTEGSAEPVLVPLCGDDAAALDVVSQLVRDVGGTPAVLGGLRRAGQLEQVGGFVIGLAFAGAQPREAIPSIPSIPDGLRRDVA